MKPVREPGLVEEPLVRMVPGEVTGQDISELLVVGIVDVPSRHERNVGKTD